MKIKVYRGDIAALLRALSDCDDGGLLWEEAVSLEVDGKRCKLVATSRPGDTDVHISLEVDSEQ